MNEHQVWAYDYSAGSRDGNPNARRTDLDIELLPGCKLYLEASFTLLNKTPLEDHQALALLGFKPSGEVPFDVEELVLRLLHSRAVGLIRNDNADKLTLKTQLQRGIDPKPGRYSFIDNIVTDDPRLPVWDGGFASRHMELVGQEWKQVTRVFSRSNDGWAVTDYTDWPAVEATEDTKKRLRGETLPAEAVIIIPRGFDLLYQPQRSYREIESCFARMQRLQTGVNGKTVISGYMGNVEQAHSELGRVDRDVALFPTGATVNRVVASADIDRCISEYNTLLPLYLKALHIGYVEDKTHITADRSRLTLLPMITFENKVRSRVNEVLALFNLTAEYDVIEVEDAAQKTARYTLLKTMRADGAIDDTKFKEKAAQLAA